MAERKTKAAAIEVRELLDKAMEVATTEGDLGWITSWLGDQDNLEGYGYTVELEEKIQDLEEKIQDLEEKIQDLEERLEKLPEDTFPALPSMADAMKMEYFLEHFKDIPLEALEWIVRENHA